MMWSALCCLNVYIYIYIYVYVYIDKYLYTYLCVCNRHIGHTLIFLWHHSGPTGSLALKQFPEKRKDILRVQENPCFVLEDLSWISACLGHSIRLTVAKDLHQAMQDSDTQFDLPEDVIFGDGGVAAHLYYSWKTAAHEDRRFGHYDILLPTNRQLFTIPLPMDVARMDMLYIYIYLFIYLYNIYIYALFFV